MPTASEGPGGKRGLPKALGARERWAEDNLAPEFLIEALRLFRRQETRVGRLRGEGAGCMGIDAGLFSSEDRGVRSRRVRRFIKPGLTLPRGDGCLVEPMRL